MQQMFLFAQEPYVIQSLYFAMIDQIIRIGFNENIYQLTLHFLGFQISALLPVDCPSMFWISTCMDLQEYLDGAQCGFVKTWASL